MYPYIHKEKTKINGVLLITINGCIHHSLTHCATHMTTRYCGLKRQHFHKHSIQCKTTKRFAKSDKVNLIYKQFQSTTNTL